ncbi:hypothetical protein H257_09887 [Aphanomyces astaci]|uniref:Uncharacterized protein n=1 Tax=Aphanomyces astaci TaxID=112090 RepID=W4G9F8_APHAT|nr:hypothetical protein H257_09887 [Aphanomyces astaci]ETV75926.1 hypothetical protein H257_09887 [Aphanomyces astaci]|eukprot:XP_009834568.1 hypothetical protein H257_09887 [Aphanomyces astaci]
MAAADGATMSTPTFFRINCSHKDLFRESYIRCYQNHGLKVIRCFPHCCPHMEYRGCGSSLSVRVHDPAHYDRNDLQAFGRFQVASEATYAPNDVVSLSTFTSDLRSQRNAMGLWLQGHRQPPGEDGSLVYHFNEKRTDGWHYTWHGGSSTKKREALHLFQVYVVAVVPNNNDDKCVIGWSVATPPFKLSSYRRAKSADDSSSSDVVKPKVVKTTRTTQPAQLAPRRGGLPVKSEALTRIQRQAHQLAIAHTFCTSILIGDVAQRWPAIERQLVAQCRDWIGHPSDDVATSMPTMPSVVLPPELIQVSGMPWGAHHEIALNMIWRWFDPAVFTRVQQYTHDHACDDVHLMPQVYDVGIGFLHSMVADMLASHSHSFDEFVRLALANDSNPLPAHREPPTIGLHALLRTLQTNAKLKNSDAAAFNTPSQQLRIQQTHEFWVLSIVQLRRMSLRPTVVAFFRVFTMLFAVHTRLDGHLFFVKSHVPMFVAMGTEFHLNGEPNQFQAFPNGESCGLHRFQLDGDYIGWTEVYTWSVGDSPPRWCTLLRVCISPDVQNSKLCRVAWTLEYSDHSSMENLKHLGVDDRIRVWNDVPHSLVLQLDTTYTRMDNV